VGRAVGGTDGQTLGSLNQVQYYQEFMHVWISVPLMAATVVAQAPPGYYASVVATSPASLRATLHAVIDDHTRIPYTATSTDTWNVLELADQHPTVSTQILDVYKNAAYTKVGGGNSLYNREHTWPNSYGFPIDGATNYPFTDCHHLFLCDIPYNQHRDNKIFDIGLASWTGWPTLLNAGQGGGSTSYPGTSNWGTTTPPLGGFQVWSGRKGDIARAMFYMDVRYEGGTHGVTGAAEPDLRLTDNLTLIGQSATGSNLQVAYMGKLSVLLQWHVEDPVDAKEIARNNAVFQFQGNRNPFIDNPSWVACLYQGQCVRVREPEVWINELHYDNVGTDVDEFVEVAGRAGERLDGWMLVAYDGTTGQAYDKVALTGTLPNQQAGFGVRSFLFPNLQNGSPDGIALVTPDGVVMQFVSYEGAFTAVGGAANGRTSIDIGVSQTGTTPIGWSLQLTGSGSKTSQFTWQPPALATPGLPNTGQSFL
jgi:endonuclease I